MVLYKCDLLTFPTTRVNTIIVNISYSGYQSSFIYQLLFLYWN